MNSPILGLSRFPRQILTRDFRPGHWGKLIDRLFLAGGFCTRTPVTELSMVQHDNQGPGIAGVGIGKQYAEQQIACVCSADQLSTPVEARNHLKGDAKSRGSVPSRWPFH
jgi:hypothetical protein